MEPGWFPVGELEMIEIVTSVEVDRVHNNTLCLIRVACTTS